MNITSLDAGDRAIAMCRSLADLAPVDALSILTLAMVHQLTRMPSASCAPTVERITELLLVAGEDHRTLQ